MSVLRNMQPAFVGGLLSSTLWSRVDLSKYATGLKRADNILLHAHGGASNRPGLVFVDETRINGKARLLPFDFDVGSDQTYILVFTHQKLRIIRSGSPIKSGNVGDSNRPYYEVDTPYGDADIDQLVMVQEKDIAYISHRNHPPHKLSRYGDLDWRLEEMDFSIKMTAPTDVAASVQSGSGSTSYSYKVSAVHKSTKEESLPSVSVSISNDLTTAGHKNKISWTAHSDASKYVVYKEDNGLYGLAGTTTATSFIDENITADLSDAPQLLAPESKH